MQPRIPGVNSMRVLLLSEADTCMLAEKVVDGEDVDRRDIAIIFDMSMSKYDTIRSQMNIILARFVEGEIGHVEINIFRHYGNGE